MLCPRLPKRKIFQRQYQIQISCLLWCPNLARRGLRAQTQSPLIYLQTAVFDRQRAVDIFPRHRVDELHRRPGCFSSRQLNHLPLPAGVHWRQKASNLQIEVRPRRTEFKLPPLIRLRQHGQAQAFHLLTARVQSHRVYLDR